MDERTEGAAETFPGATGSTEAVAEVGAAGASALRSLDSPRRRDCINGLLALLVLIAAGLR